MQSVSLRFFSCVSGCRISRVIHDMESDSGQPSGSSQEGGTPPAAVSPVKASSPSPSKSILPGLLGRSPSGAGGHNLTRLIFAFHILKNRDLSFPPISEIFSLEHAAIILSSMAHVRPSTSGFAVTTHFPLQVLFSPFAHVFAFLYFLCIFSLVCVCMCVCSYVYTSTCVRVFCACIFM